MSNEYDRLATEATRALRLLVEAGRPPRAAGDYLGVILCLGITSPIVWWKLTSGFVTVGGSEEDDIYVDGFGRREYEIVFDEGGEFSLQTGLPYSGKRIHVHHPDGTKSGPLRRADLRYGTQFTVTPHGQPGHDGIAFRLIPYSEGYASATEAPKLPSPHVSNMAVREVLDMAVAEESTEDVGLTVIRLLERALREVREPIIVKAILHDLDSELRHLGYERRLLNGETSTLKRIPSDGTEEG